MSGSGCWESPSNLSLRLYQDVLVFTHGLEKAKIELLRLAAYCWNAGRGTTCSLKRLSRLEKHPTCQLLPPIDLDGNKMVSLRHPVRIRSLVVRIGIYRGRKSGQDAVGRPSSCRATPTLMPSDIQLVKKWRSLAGSNTVVDSHEQLS